MVHLPSVLLCSLASSGLGAAALTANAAHQGIVPFPRLARRMEPPPGGFPPIMEPKQWRKWNAEREAEQKRVLAGLEHLPFHQQHMDEPFRTSRPAAMRKTSSQTKGLAEGYNRFSKSKDLHLEAGRTFHEPDEAMKWDDLGKTVKSRPGSPSTTKTRSRPGTPPPETEHTAGHHEEHTHAGGSQQHERGPHGQHEPKEEAGSGS